MAAKDSVQLVAPQGDAAGFDKNIRRSGSFRLFPWHPSAALLLAHSHYLS